MNQPTMKSAITVKNQAGNGPRVGGLTTLTINIIRAPSAPTVPTATYVRVSRIIVDRFDERLAFPGALREKNPDADGVSAIAAFQVVGGKVITAVTASSLALIGVAVAIRVRREPEQWQRPVGIWLVLVLGSALIIRYGHHVDVWCCPS